VISGAKPLGRAAISADLGRTEVGQNALESGERSPAMRAVGLLVGTRSATLSLGLPTAASVKEPENKQEH
jgi:hypothetical protein